MEPLDIPLSPTEIFSDRTEDVAASSDFEKLMNLHEEDDPGGEEEVNDADERLHFCELPAPPDLNDNEDQMEFVPTDFLEQQDILEEPESSCTKDDSKKESPDYASTNEDDTLALNEIQFSKEKKMT